MRFASPGPVGAVQRARWLLALVRSPWCSSWCCVAGGCGRCGFQPDPGVKVVVPAMPTTLDWSYSDPDELGELPRHARHPARAHHARAGPLRAARAGRAVGARPADRQRPGGLHLPPARGRALVRWRHPAHRAGLRLRLAPGPPWAASAGRWRTSQGAEEVLALQERGAPAEQVEGRARPRGRGGRGRADAAGDAGAAPELLPRAPRERVPVLPRALGGPGGQVRRGGARLLRPASRRAARWRSGPTASSAGTAPASACGWSTTRTPPSRRPSARASAGAGADADQVGDRPGALRAGPRGLRLRGQRRWRSGPRPRRTCSASRCSPPTSSPSTPSARRWTGPRCAAPWRAPWTARRCWRGCCPPRAPATSSCRRSCPGAATPEEAARLPHFDARAGPRGAGPGAGPGRGRCGWCYRAGDSFVPGGGHRRAHRRAARRGGRAGDAGCALGLLRRGGAPHARGPSRLRPATCAAWARTTRTPTPSSPSSSATGNHQTGWETQKGGEPMDRFETAAGRGGRRARRRPARAPSTRQAQAVLLDEMAVDRAALPPGPLLPDASLLRGAGRGPLQLPLPARAAPGASRRRCTEPCLAALVALGRQLVLVPIVALASYFLMAALPLHHGGRRQAAGVPRAARVLPERPGPRGSRSASSARGRSSSRRAAGHQRAGRHRATSCS